MLELLVLFPADDGFSVGKGMGGGLWGPHLI